MKNLFLLCLICFTFTLSAQSYFNEARQSSSGIKLQYAPNIFLDRAFLQYVYSVKGRLDISPEISYGGNPTTSTLFTAGIGADYFIIKQNSKLPFSFSFGAHYSYIRSSSLGFSSNSNFGILNAHLYHKMNTSNIFIIPLIGYVQSFNLDTMDTNTEFFEIASAFGYELENGNIVSLTPRIQFPTGETQFVVGLGYNFGRIAFNEEN